MEITGKIIAVLPERSGTSARNGSEWVLGQYVLETLEGQYPRKMVFEIFGADKIAQLAIKLGETLTVSFDIDAREYQGKWYNSIRAWKVDRSANAAGPNAQMAQAAPAAASIPPFGAPAAPAAPAGMAGGPTDDLPF